MQKVTILSRASFLTYVPDLPKEQVVAIRIGDKRAPLKDSASQYYLDSLSMAFFDERTLFEDQINRSYGTGSNMFSEKDKRLVDDFVDKYQDKYFVIHCEEGKSRSAAIGYYILKKLGCTKELNQKKESGRFDPNPQVYGLLIGKPYTMGNAGEVTTELITSE
ncbi:hypothetical protein [Oenococcus kitaharae]|uniref:Tyrosine specific protein phosphatases domain-containing protein n=1 Tax=Oenococcus kitaharae DSM 17330 TaxID=1045004 RepID=G9WJV8_9LACO|nr:hypothetical protein [Oenococcus kitaharae]EHN58126.1 hypothetical protein OKIT_1881 [Oenococcus kitaharae DSM 17330]OEY82410.1 hypothetical protein NV75_08370 [Oenococcus kitaharae]OEY82552.1 hypothetical protein NT95_06170 [Oenococcus kitaharae]OEY84203.1 hypothetical protein NT96_05315 [Oenococcus kitaharae]